MALDHAVRRHGVAAREGAEAEGAAGRSRRQAWTVVVPSRPRTVRVLRLRDRFGNRVAKSARVRVGKLAALDWPTNIGTGDGRTPGALGDGQFPP